MGKRPQPPRPHPAQPPDEQQPGEDDIVLADFEAAVPHWRQRGRLKQREPALNGVQRYTRRQRQEPDVEVEHAERQQSRRQK